MRFVSILLLLFVQNSIAQSGLDDTGFGEIRLGKSFESIENRLSVTDIHGIPEYAWFAPMSLDYWLANTGEDTASYYEMLETDRLVAESLNLNIIQCTFSKKKDAKFFNSSIACAQLIFEKNALKGIILAFEKDEITTQVKESIFKQFEAVFGEPLEDSGAVSSPRKFDSNWKLNGRQIRVSDALSMEGGTGETVHVLYWQE